MFSNHSTAYFQSVEASFSQILRHRAPHDVFALRTFGVGDGRNARAPTERVRHSDSIAQKLVRPIAQKTSPADRRDGA